MSASAVFPLALLSLLPLGDHEGRGDSKFRHPFYLFKAPSALECEASNEATHGPHTLRA
jgi:hypothetical protein